MRFPSSPLLMASAKVSRPHFQYGRLFLANIGCGLWTCSSAPCPSRAGDAIPSSTARSRWNSSRSRSSSACRYWNERVPSPQMSPSELLFLVDDRFRHPLTAGLPGLPNGFQELQSEPGSLALDFIRGNLFDRLRLRPLPHDLPGPDNDLSDRIEHYVARARQEHDSEV